jgi:hypothetical protein
MGMREPGYDPSMAAALLMTESEMLGDLFAHNIAVLIECDPDSMPGVTVRAFNRHSPTPIAVCSGHTLHEALARMHDALLG